MNAELYLFLLDYCSHIHPEISCSLKSFTSLLFINLSQKPGFLKQL